MRDRSRPVPEAPMRCGSVPPTTISCSDGEASGSLDENKENKDPPRDQVDACRHKTNNKARRKRKDDDSDLEQREQSTRPRKKSRTQMSVATSFSGKNERSAKRKAADDLEEPLTKKQMMTKEGGRTGKEPARKPLRTLWERGILTSAPDDIFDVYVFGANRKGELGLASKDIREPIQNAQLSGQEPGIVQIATGSNHCVALTYSNQILTWGYNTGGALGRGVPRDLDDDQESDDSEPQEWEYTPMAIPSEDFPPRYKDRRRQELAGEPIFTKVVAGSTFSFALTDDGYVYGWGTFKMSDGSVGFLEAEAQKNYKNPGTGRTFEARPVLIPSLDKIVKITCGKNHVVALRNNGEVYTWGGTEHGCLGRQVSSRRPRFHYLKPTSVIKKNITDIYCGSYHNFAVKNDDTIWTWGWNSHQQTGIEPGEPGDIEEIILNPSRTMILEGLGGIRQMAGGNFISAAILDQTHQCQVWGRTDTSTLGLDINATDPKSFLRDINGHAIVLTEPRTMMPSDFVEQVTLGPHHGIAITSTGRAFSWGDSRFYQTGQNDDRPIDAVPMRVQNPNINDEIIIWAGTGEEYGMLASKHLKQTPPLFPRKRLFDDSEVEMPTKEERDMELRRELQQMLSQEETDDIRDPGPSNQSRVQVPGSMLGPAAQLRTDPLVDVHLPKFEQKHCE